MNLKHANIVKVRDFFEDIQSGKSYLVMEQAGKMSLQDLVQRKPLSEREAKSLTRQLLEAIIFLHSEGICHRDLKPDNIRVDF